MNKNQLQTTTEGEVFENLQTGDKVLWDGIKQPVTVTADYKQGKKDIEQYDNIEDPTILLEGPQGGEKLMQRAPNNKNAVRVATWSMNAKDEWVSNLRIVNWE